MLMRRFRVVLTVALLTACRTAAPGPDADAIVEGRAVGVVPDTVTEVATVSLDQQHYVVRDHPSATSDFWQDIAVLDVRNAERAAKTLDQRTFALALRTLMSSDPEGAAVAFGALHSNTLDPVVRARARVGLTMALSWASDWASLASIGTDPDSADVADTLAREAAVERWAHALANLPKPTIDVPDHAVTLPLKRSAFGTPIIEVRINGRPHEFWLDTGASMTLMSVGVAERSGVKLAAPDTLALGVVAGHIPARAVFVDSLGIGPIVARRLSAALVNEGVLRLDRRVVNGVMEQVQIDGVIGTDVLRQLDVVMDAGAGSITIKRPRRDASLARNLYWVGYPVVRLVTRDGHPVLFGLDTGAEGTYITTSLLKKQPETPVAMRKGTIGGLGSDQHTTEWVARSIALSDGDYAMTLRNIPVAPERRWTFMAFDGIIGSDIALHSRLHLDFVNGVFDLRKSANAERGVVFTIGH
jgi:predicted aspartyl protease